MGSFIDEMHDAKVNSTLAKYLELLHADGVDPSSNLWIFAMMRFEKQTARELWVGIDPPEQRVKWLSMCYDYFKKGININI